MRMLHLSDLHIGKSIANYSLIEDQKYALDQIVDIVEREKVDLVIIAGDIFDTAITTTEALEVYDDFIERIIFDLNRKVIAISGNHDSAKRLDVHRKFFRKNQYYLIGEYEGEVITLEDKYGPINFYPIPYISLPKARTMYDRDFESFTDLYSFLLKDINYVDRNVLISHCYASETSFEEEKIEGEKPLSIGGNDAMDAHLFLNFDYVALGHLHRKHYILDERIRYCGTFMKFSFSEINQRKTVTLVDLTDQLEIREIELDPLHDFKIYNDYFDNILDYDDSKEYIQFILNDDHPIENAMQKLKKKFPNAVNIKYQEAGVFQEGEKFDLDLENLDLMELFQSFYKYKMDSDMKKEEIDIFKKVIE